MGGQPLPAPQGANLQAAISAGVKATAKQAADLWHETRRPKIFSLLKGDLIRRRW